jgi:hypothetical protein
VPCSSNEAAVHAAEHMSWGTSSTNSCKEVHECSETNLTSTIRPLLSAQMQCSCWTSAGALLLGGWLVVPSDQLDWMAVSVSFDSCDMHSVVVQRVVAACMVGRKLPSGPTMGAATCMVCACMTCKLHTYHHKLLHSQMLSFNSYAEPLAPSLLLLWRKHGVELPLHAGA